METVMTLGKYAAGLGAIASLLCSTAAVAADATRSSGALPVATGQPAPIQGIRAATPLKKQSNAISQNAGIVLGIAAGAAIGTAISVASGDDDDEHPTSPRTEEGRLRKECVDQ